MASTRGRASWTLWRIDHTASDYWHAGDGFGTLASGRREKHGSIGVMRPPGLLIVTDAPGVAVKKRRVPLMRTGGSLSSGVLIRACGGPRRLVHRRAGTNQIMIDTAAMVDRNAALLAFGTA